MFYRQCITFKLNVIMKKTLIFAIGLLPLASCEKEPSLDNVQDQVVTYTQYDKNANFTDASTFFVADQILLIGKTKDVQYLDDADAIPIITEVVKMMNSRGYTQVSNIDDADLGIQMSYVKDTYYFTTTNYPYWWMGYPGYWSPGFWGGYWDWYYPYVNVFSYSNGSLLTDMVNLQDDTSATTGAQPKLPVVWQSYSVGLLGRSEQINVNKMVESVKQAFAQSPYIQK